ncbi:unnamed protein product [Brassica rapa]|uniref:Major facilitator superfamily (MFS) profile domain-containing protein n=1 Tax=Brassica campestris TaxID=3711 RepID=A0A3P6AFP2_BRACM|nr:unnamed protein product [Brassica rapa]VDC90547.1 unnamed protein product [Brassica rapa]
MYLGAALGMWLLPALVELRGPESVFLAETLAGVIWSLLWIRTRKFLNTVGFLVASAALMALPQFRTSNGVILCSSVALWFLALGRAGFAVNHMDIAPRYAGIVMGVSNTAGTLAGIISVDLTGKLLEASKLVYSDLSHQESWRAVFFIPGLLCIFSSVVFLLFSTGERIFD